MTTVKDVILCLIVFASTTGIVVSFLAKTAGIHTALSLVTITVSVTFLLIIANLLPTIMYQ